MSDQGDPILTKPIKIQNLIKWNPRWNGAIRCLPTQVVQALKSRSGCKNSEKIWWMTKFQNMEDPSKSVQNKNFTGNSKKLAKVLGARWEAKSHLHWQFFGIWQSLWRIILKSLYVNTSPFWNKWDCWKSSAQSKGRHLCCSVAIRSEWKLVCRFYGMLYLSAEHAR